MEKSNNLKETEISELKRENALLHDSICKINLKLRVIDGTKEPTNQSLYIVEPGDNLWNISRRHLGKGIRFQEIVTLNHLASDAIILPGDTLRLPDK